MQFGFCLILKIIIVSKKLFQEHLQSVSNSWCPDKACHILWHLVYVFVYAYVPSKGRLAQINILFCKHD